MNKILPIGALVFAGVIMFMYVKPTYTGSVAATQATIAGDDQALAAAGTYSEKENQLISAKNAIAPADLARLEQFLPSSVNNVQMILDLNALAVRSGVILSNINVTSPATDITTGQVGEVDLTLSVASSYPAFRTFLQSIEHSERLLDIGALSVSGSDTGVYTYNLTLRLYWLR